MVNVFDANPTELIERTAVELKKLGMQPPEWSRFCKTGHGRERPPVRDDWWYVRAASVLRKVSILGPVGVSKLKVKYGNRKNRGHKPDKFIQGSGNIIRKILQQLEALELIKQAEKGVHKGRVVAPKGQSLLAKIAIQISKESKASKKPETKKEEKEVKESKVEKTVKTEEKVKEEKEVKSQEITESTEENE